MMKKEYQLNGATKSALSTIFYIKNITFDNLLFFLLLFFAGTSVSQSAELNGSSFVGPGLVWQGSAATMPQTHYSVGNKAINYVGTNVVARGLSWGSVDGYYGIIIAEGIVAVLDGYSNVSSQLYNGNTEVVNVNFSFNSNPIPAGQNSPTEIAYSEASSVYRINVSYSKVGNDATGQYDASASVIGGIYIGSSAKSGTYSYPSIEVLPGTGRSLNYQKTVLSPFGEAAGSFKYQAAALECTISTPPTVDFGKVPAKGDGWVAVGNQESLVKINCNSDDPNGVTEASISFTGGPLYYNRKEMLELMTDGSSGVGILNGRYGSGNISSCSSNNSGDSSAVTFNGSVSKTLEIKVGTNEVPITWTLCRRGDTQMYGDVSAQATMNLNWD